MFEHKEEGRERLGVGAVEGRDGRKKVIKFPFEKKVFGKEISKCRCMPDMNHAKTRNVMN